MSTREIFTIVSATGHATTAFKTASFSVTTVARAKDNASARAEADEVLEKVMDAINDLNAGGAAIDMHGLKCSYDTQPWQEYDRNTNEQKHKGYMVTGSVSCSTENVDAATVIMDTLTKIDDGATVQRPSFSADDTAEAREAAFKAAFERAVEDFNLQCAVLGVDPDDYEIVRYSPTDEAAQYGGMRAVAQASLSAEAPMAAPAEIKAGRAETSAYVQLTYAKKTPGLRVKPQTRATSGNGKTKRVTRSAGASAD